MKLVLDIENTVTFNDKNIDGSPYNTNNKLVMVQYHNLDTNEKGHLEFYHNEVYDTSTQSAVYLSELLGTASTIIGHNLKHDMSWLFECGFKYSGEYWDTMIFEYIYAKGLKLPLGLKDVCSYYGLSAKSDILGDYFDKKINTNEVPLAELVEYGMADIQSTVELYFSQLERLNTDSLTAGMLPAIKLSNDLLHSIIEMERNGCYIDTKALHEVKEQYIEESTRLSTILNRMAGEVMGDTPINLQSPADLSKVVYSREVKDKKLWKESFNLGYILKNGIKKRRKPKKYLNSVFKQIVKEQMNTVYRTEAFQCDVCTGKGKIKKVKKDGTDFKKDTICPSCEGAGFIYTPLDKIAGFKVMPLGSISATINGFATDKKTIEQLTEKGKLSDDAREFLSTLTRLNAVQTYLSTFVDGIERNTKEDFLLHTSLNQCITATGRLSSSNPNFQNLPRENTFPIRKVIKSRFEGGYIFEVDWSALEYRVAVLLSRDKAGIASIEQGKDRHAVTAKILFNATKDMPNFKEYRQKAKPETFKPLYGGSKGTIEQETYYQAFKDEHVELTKYQTELCNNAVKYGYIVSPSGRVYAFPNTQRITPYQVTNQTMIYNYNIQGFATADIMPCALVILHRLMQENNTKSKLILTVHDSVEVDVHPEELELITRLVYEAFSSVEKDLKDRFNFDCCIPLAFEMSYGDNWMNKKEIHYEPTSQKIVA